jgi:hypothetical protein
VGGVAGTTPPVPSATPAPIAELGNDVVRVLAAGEETCAVRTDGSLWCFGTGYSTRRRWRSYPAATRADRGEPKRGRSLSLRVGDAAPGGIVQLGTEERPRETAGFDCA